MEAPKRKAKVSSSSETKSQPIQAAFLRTLDDIERKHKRMLLYANGDIITRANSTGIIGARQRLKSKAKGLRLRMRAQGGVIPLPKPYVANIETLTAKYNKSGTEDIHEILHDIRAMVEPSDAYEIPYADVIDLVCKHAGDAGGVKMLKTLRLVSRQWCAIASRYVHCVRFRKTYRPIKPRDKIRRPKTTNRSYWKAPLVRKTVALTFDEVFDGLRSAFPCIERMRIDEKWLSRHHNDVSLLSAFAGPNITFYVDNGADLHFSTLDMKGGSVVVDDKHSVFLPARYFKNVSYGEHYDNPLWNCASELVITSISAFFAHCSIHVRSRYAYLKRVGGITNTREGFDTKELALQMIYLDPSITDLTTTETEWFLEFYESQSVPITATFPATPHTIVRPANEYAHIGTPLAKRRPGQVYEVLPPLPGK